MTLRARVVPVAAVTDGELAQMWRLFEATYEDVDEATFRVDLAAKQHVIVLDDGAVQGFSTMREIEVTVAGRRHLGLFSGDTVVAPAYWGTRVLGRAFLGHLFARRLRAPLTPYWWILISKGYKTYLMMANNFEEHWPRHEQSTPPDADVVIRAFGDALFGADYRADAGVVRWERPRGRLRAGLADVTPALIEASPRVAFFERRNPGWRHGDELFCVARMQFRMPFWYAWKSLRGGAS
jgi:hypothetical protein